MRERGKERKRERGAESREQAGIEHPVFKPSSLKWRGTRRGLLTHVTVLSLQYNRMNVVWYEQYVCVCVSEFV